MAFEVLLLSPKTKKGGTDLELASEGITNVTEYCKLLPVALFPKQQCGVLLGLSLQSSPFGEVSEYNDFRAKRN